MSRERQKKDAERPWPERPFISDTTYGKSYDADMVAKGRPAKKVPQPQSEMASIPFTMGTTYGADFVPKTSKYTRHKNMQDQQFSIRKFVATTTHGARSLTKRWVELAPTANCRGQCMYDILRPITHTLRVLDSNYSMTRSDLLGD
eukprot:104945-Pyramimonas_sp.AAC.1